MDLLPASIFILAAATCIINTTPHNIDYRWVDADGVNHVTTYPPVTTPTRVSEVITPATDVDINDVPVKFVTAATGEVENLPEPVDGTLYIVSRMTFDACPDRIDLIAPMEFIRDDANRIVGCAAFLTR